MCLWTRKVQLNFGGRPVQCNPTFVCNPALVCNPTFVFNPAFVCNPTFVCNPALVCNPTFVCNLAFAKDCQSLFVCVLLDPDLGIF